MYKKIYHHPLHQESPKLDRPTQTSPAFLGHPFKTCDCEWWWVPQSRWSKKKNKTYPKKCAWSIYSLVFHLGTTWPIRLGLGCCGTGR
jgi:hypothetical protein